MQLYADEDIALPVMDELRRLGHDVVTAQDDGRAGESDADILARGNSLGRVVLTHNRRHYQRLHRQGTAHCGIVSVTQDTNHSSLAARINSAVQGVAAGRWHIRVNRPAKP
ncbi:MAG: DUF5615 family PIN-like protein [Planctomycetes bacterium]|nr:DUF5615 family PIN-like protein [Planctomycetota bacterium]